MFGWEMHAGILIHDNMFGLILQRLGKKSLLIGIFRKFSHLKVATITISKEIFKIFFSIRWDEMGRYDLPTSMNYALKVGGQKKLSFVCISFGCTLFFIAAIEHQNLNHQVESVFALAPSTFMTRVDDPFLREVFRFYNQIVVYQIIYEHNI